MEVFGSNTLESLLGYVGVVLVVWEGNGENDKDPGIDKEKKQCVGQSIKILIAPYKYKTFEAKFVRDNIWEHETKGKVSRPRCHSLEKKNEKCLPGIHPKQVVLLYILLIFFNEKNLVWCSSQAGDPLFPHFFYFEEEWKILPDVHPRQVVLFFSNFFFRIILSS